MDNSHIVHSMHALHYRSSSMVKCYSEQPKSVPVQSNSWQRLWDKSSYDVTIGHCLTSCQFLYFGSGWMRGMFQPLWKVYFWQELMYQSLWNIIILVIHTRAMLKHNSKTVDGCIKGKSFLFISTVKHLLSSFPCVLLHCK